MSANQDCTTKDAIVKTTHNLNDILTYIIKLFWNMNCFFINQGYDIEYLENEKERQFYESVGFKINKCKYYYFEKCDYENILKNIIIPYDKIFVISKDADEYYSIEELPPHISCKKIEISKDIKQDDLTLHDVYLTIPSFFDNEHRHMPCNIFLKQMSTKNDFLTIDIGVDEWGS